MFSTESQWLHEKKKCLLEEYISLDTKAFHIYETHTEEFTKLEKEKQKIEAELDSVRKAHDQQIAKMSHTISELEQLAAKKVRELQTSEHALKEAEFSIQKLKKKCFQMGNELNSAIVRHQGTQQQLAQFKQSCQRQSKQNLRTQKQQVDSLITKYEGLIETRVQELQNSYQKEIQSIKAHNEELLSKIEQQSIKKVTKNDEQSKRIHLDYTRLIQENRKLISSINDSKLKVMDLESTITSLTQQNKIAAKEKQYAIENLKRELQMTKEQNVDLQSRNRKLIESNDELAWTSKELHINHSDELKRIKVETSRELNECLESGLKSIAKLEAQKEILTSTILKVQKELTEKVKEVNLLKDELQRYKKRIQTKQQEERQQQQLIQRAKEHKKEMLKKDSEIEALSEEIKRLKAKVNKITGAYHQNIKGKEILEKENKMLLSEIVFLRDNKEKDKKKGDWSKVLDDVKSQVSREEGGLLEELESYKQLIAEMEGDMQSALQKIEQRDRTIDKQKSIISRLEKALELK